MRIAMTIAAAIILALIFPAPASAGSFALVEGEVVNIAHEEKRTTRATGPHATTDTLFLVVEVGERQTAVVDFVGSLEGGTATVGQLRGEPVTVELGDTVRIRAALDCAVLGGGEECRLLVRAVKSR